MSDKKVSLIINPRTGENVAKIRDIQAVLSAAGWKAEIALKEYGKHGIELAKAAANQGQDFIVAYGGDGTLNQIINGVMSAKDHTSIIGIMPGGTANVWAGEIGVPLDPVKAALALVSSQVRKVDVGCIQVHSVKFPGEEPIAITTKAKKKALKESNRVRKIFLLMAGLGIDAAIMNGVSKPLKYRIGPLAVGLSAAKEISEQRPFPIEIQSVDEDAPTKMLWKGEAMQVVIGNTRRYGGVVEITSDAYIDDGMLDLRVITVGDPLTTMQQLSSLLLRHKLDTTSSEYLRAAQLCITVPATVPFQVDGSSVKLKDYLSKADYAKLQTLTDPSEVMITYQLSALSKALDVAIPYTYNDELFEHAATHKHAGEDLHPLAGKEVHAKSLPQKGPLPMESALQQYTVAVETKPESELTQGGEQEKKQEEETKPVEEASKDSPDFLRDLLQKGHKVTVIGKVPNPAQEHTFIIAGSITKAMTDELRPVAIVVNDHMTVLNRVGNTMADVAKVVGELAEGKQVIVEGKISKRGVIEPKRIVI